VFDEHASSPVEAEVLQLRVGILQLKSRIEKAIADRQGSDKFHSIQVVVDASVFEIGKSTFIQAMFKGLSIPGYSVNNFDAGEEKVSSGGKGMILISQGYRELERQTNILLMKESAKNHSDTHIAVHLSKVDDLSALPQEVLELADILIDYSQPDLRLNPEAMVDLWKTNPEVASSWGKKDKRADRAMMGQDKGGIDVKKKKGTDPDASTVPQSRSPVEILSPREGLLELKSMIEEAVKDQQETEENHIIAILVDASKRRVGKTTFINAIADGLSIPGYTINNTERGELRFSSGKKGKIILMQGYQQIEKDPTFFTQKALFNGDGFTYITVHLYRENDLTSLSGNIRELSDIIIDYSQLEKRLTYDEMVDFWKEKKADPDTASSPRERDKGGDNSMLTRSLSESEKEISDVVRKMVDLLVFLNAGLVGIQEEGLPEHKKKELFNNIKGFIKQILDIENEYRNSKIPKTKRQIVMMEDLFGNFRPKAQEILKENAKLNGFTIEFLAIFVSGSFNNKLLAVLQALVSGELRDEDVKEPGAVGRGADHAMLGQDKGGVRT